MPLNLYKLLRHQTWLSARRRLEWYPPFWLMRVRVVELSDDGRRIYLRLPLTLLSRNMGDSMFGGYQAAIADPVAAMACNRVFPGYAVFTRAMSIDFIYPGNSDLELRFDLPPEVEQVVAAELAQKGRSTPTFHYGLYRDDGVLCTRVENTVAIRPLGYQAAIKKRHIS
ncbi:MAG: PaaI family thioesterase [Gammaproteobacteria bacterium]